MNTLGPNMNTLSTKKCEYGEVILTREEGANAVGDAFKSAAGGANPIFGAIVGAFLPDTFTANVMKACPGKVTDHRTGYWPEMVLAGVGVALLFAWGYFKFSRK